MPNLLLLFAFLLTIVSVIATAEVAITSISFDDIEKDDLHFAGQAYNIMPSTNNDPFDRNVCSNGSLSKTVLSKIDMLESSGISELDEYIDLQLTKLNRITNHFPFFSFYDDSEGANAKAIHCGTKSYILLGRNMSSSWINSSKPSDTSLPAVAALLMHEYAHLTQYEYGLQYYNKMSALELLSDAMAGWYLAYTIEEMQRNPPKNQSRKKINTILKLSIDNSLAIIFDIGDTAFHLSNHHGTPRERKLAFNHGYNIFENGIKNYREAFEIAINERGIKRR